jgi:hypothetical protein
MPDCMLVVVTLLVVVAISEFVTGANEAGADELLIYQRIPPTTTIATTIHVTIFDVEDISI